MIIQGLSFFGPYVDGEGKTLAVDSYGDLVVGPSETVAGTGKFYEIFI